MTIAATLGYPRIGPRREWKAALESHWSGTLDDAEQLSAVFTDLEARSRSFGLALTGALKGAVVDGKGLESVLRGLALRMSDIALSVGLKPLEGLLSSGISSLLGGATPFAKGGVVASPTYFGSGGGLGLMGEVAQARFSALVQAMKATPKITLQQ